MPSPYSNGIRIFNLSKNILLLSPSKSIRIKSLVSGIIFQIATNIGIPLRVDGITIFRARAKFAKVNILLNFSLPLP